MFRTPPTLKVLFLLCCCCCCCLLVAVVCAECVLCGVQADRSLYPVHCTFFLIFLICCVICCCIQVAIERQRAFGLYQTALDAIAKLRGEQPLQLPVNSNSSVLRKAQGDIRNTMITEIHTRIGPPVEKLQALSDSDLLATVKLMVGKFDESLRFE